VIDSVARDTQVVARVCPTCGAHVQGRYCGECGERMLGARDESFSAFVGEAASEVFTLDNRLWRTLRRMWRPGFLTVEYVAGRRRPYLSPVHVFLILTIAFFFIGPDLGLMATNLRQFESDPITSVVAVPIVEAGMARTGLDHAAFTRRFEATMAGQRRFLLGLAVPVFALMLKGLYRRRSYVVHLVFATHAVATILVLVFVYLLALFVTLALLFPLIVRIPGQEALWPPSLPVAIVAVMTPVLLFIYAALRRVHGEAGARAVAKAFVATVGLWVSLLIYEHLLFFTTALAVWLRG
jgi:hypothetical protein